MTRSRTVTIVGSKRDANNGVYLSRAPKNLDKNNGFKEMNITDWGHVDISRIPDKSCITFLSYLEDEARTDQFRRHLRELFFSRVRNV